MNMKSRALHELEMFSKQCLSSASLGDDFAVAANLEALLWLHLGVELEIFPGKETAQVWEAKLDSFQASFDQMQRSRAAVCFSRETRDFLKKAIRARSLQFVTHPKRLNKQLFDPFIIEMLFHQIGCCFENELMSEFSAGIAFEQEYLWRTWLRLAVNTASLVEHKPKNKTDRIYAGYLGMLEHMGALRDIFNYVDAEIESNYALAELKQRIRNMHSWRLNLADEEVKGRFLHLTAEFKSELEFDPDLGAMDFNALLARIQELCANWLGVDSFLMNMPSGQGNRKRKVG
jgi:hypothetical protein